MESNKATQVHVIRKTCRGLLHMRPDGKIIPGRIDEIQLATGDIVKSILERDDVVEVVATVSVSNGAKTVNFVARNEFSKPQ